MKKNLLILLFAASILGLNAQYTKLLDLGGITSNGGNPNGSLISDGTFLYGMTQQGGANSLGVVFKIKPDGTGYADLLDFAGSSNGKNPYGSLISDGTHLFGMTQSGGTNDYGVIFKIKPDGTGYTKLLDFAGASNGKNPYGALFSDGTFFYGMTQNGGINDLGVIFKIKPDGTDYSKLLDFTGTSNGKNPRGSLISDGTFLYGMAGGGMYGYGVIFKIMPDGTRYTKLFDFAGTSNGSSPYGSLISDGTFLYGMTESGGSYGYGVVFKIITDGTGFVKLLDFAGTSNGKNPRGSLISDGTFLYGMTQFGGINNIGVLFKILPDGTGYNKLLDFAGASNGMNPLGSLISDGTFLYGMTQNGGTYAKGRVFKIKPDGTDYYDLLNFSITTTGSYPYGSLISDGAFLYGMTEYGGTNDNGIIFKIKTDGTGFVKMHDFSNSDKPQGSMTYDGTSLFGMTRYGLFKINTDGTGFSYLCTAGCNSYGSLIYDGTYLYGMANPGMLYNLGAVFKIKPDGSDYTELLAFNGTNGAYPYGSLVTEGTFLYGITKEGGTSGKGNIFKIKTDGTQYTTLLDFNDIPYGKFPMGSLITDGTFLYGMTERGGTIDDAGTVFKIKTDGTEYTKLLDFTYTEQKGKWPHGSLISDGIYLFGMTRESGANGKGVIFKIKTDGTQYAKLLDFAGTSNGSYPYGSLISDGTFLYGMTKNGGTNDLGTIFKIGLATSIEENEAENNITVFPNPSNGKFTIRMQEIQNAQINIYNMLGELISSSVISSPLSEFDLGKHGTGIFYYQVILEQSIIKTGKLSLIR